MCDFIIPFKSEFISKFTSFKVIQNRKKFESKYEKKKITSLQF